jgi:hypothetical protein
LAPPNALLKESHCANRALGDPAHGAINGLTRPASADETAKAATMHEA